MIRTTMIAVAAILAASVASAAPGDEEGQKAALVERFTPFDQAAQGAWEATTPEPLYLAAATDKSVAAPLTLKPGAYRVVVLCDCGQMEVTLVGPDSSPLPSERADDRRAMYSLDVHAAGAYLAGIDMNDCGQAKCEIAVKVYRKKD